MERFIFTPVNETHPADSVVGLHLHRSEGDNCVSFFNLSENQGASPFVHIYPLARQVALEMLGETSLSSIRWHIANDHVATAVHFRERDGVVYRMDVENAFPFNPFAAGASLDEYARLYSEGIETTVYDAPLRPKSVFVAEHEKARGGLFYMCPDYYDNHMESSFHTYLADTVAFMRELGTGDPGIVDHAFHKFSGETVESWLRHNSLEMPYKTGSFAYPERTRKLSMVTGNAGMLVLLQEMNLPVIPVCVEREGSAIHALLKKTAGKGGPALPFQISPRLS